MRALAALALLAMHAGAPAGRILITTGDVASRPRVAPVVEALDRRGKVETVFPHSSWGAGAGASVSPNGTKVAWTGVDGVRIADVNGTNGRLLVPESKFCRSGCNGLALAWSPDGASLLISGGGPQTNALQQYSVATGKLADVAPRRPGIFYGALGFTDGGRTPVYTRNTIRSGLESYDVLVGDAVKYRIGSSNYGGSAPVLAPNGRLAAYVWPTSNGDVIRVVDLETGAHHDLRGFDPAFDLSWSRDSTRIAFPNRIPAGGWEIKTVLAAGGAVHDIGPGITETWARDGELLIVRGTKYDELWASTGTGSETLLFRTPHHLAIYSVDAS